MPLQSQECINFANCKQKTRIPDYCTLCRNYIYINKRLDCDHFGCKSKAKWILFDITIFPICYNFYCGLHWRDNSIHTYSENSRWKYRDNHKCKIIMYREIFNKYLKMHELVSKSTIFEILSKNYG